MGDHNWNYTKTDYFCLKFSAHIYHILTNFITFARFSVDTITFRFKLCKSMKSSGMRSFAVFTCSGIFLTLSKVLRTSVLIIRKTHPILKQKTTSFLRRLSKVSRTLIQVMIQSTLQTFGCWCMYVCVVKILLLCNNSLLIDNYNFSLVPCVLLLDISIILLSTFFDHLHHLP